MDHHYVEEYDIADRYLIGKLPTEEQARFEEHFVDCPECLDRLETTERFRSGLQTVAAEEAAQSATFLQTGVMATLVRLSRRQAMLFLSAILLLIALPAVLLISEIKRARGEAEQAKITSTEWRRQYEERLEAARKLEAKLQESDQKLIEQRQAAEIELEQARRARELARSEAGGLMQLPAVASFFTLVSVRGNESVNAI